MNPLVRQFGVVFACALILSLLVGALNHHLSVWNIHLGVGGLLVALAALRLHQSPALAVAFCTGLLLDANSPGYFGQNALLMLALTALVIGIRRRIPGEELPVGIAVAVIINLVVFTVRTLWYAPDWPDPGAGWLRVFADLVASQVFIVLIAPWFFSLQYHGLVWLGADPAVVNNRF